MRGLVDRLNKVVELVFIILIVMAILSIIELPFFIWKIVDIIKML